MRTKPKMAGTLAGAIGPVLLVGACSPSGSQDSSSASTQVTTSSHSKDVQEAKQFLADATSRGGYIVAPTAYQAEFKKLWKATS